MDWIALCTVLFISLDELRATENPVVSRPYDECVSVSVWLETNLDYRFSLRGVEDQIEKIKCACITKADAIELGIIDGGTDKRTPEPSTDARSI